MNLRQFGSAFAARWRGLSLWARYALVVFVLVLVIGGLYLRNSSGVAQVAETPRLRAVQVANVSDLENDTTPLPLIGAVQSRNEAEIRAQAGGSVTHLYYKLGSYVSAGTAIAEINNSSERAALLQAQGALEAAQASVSKGGKLEGESKKSALNTIKTVYSTNDDLIRSKLDVMFSNPTANSPLFVLSVTNQSLLNKVQSTRLKLGGLLKEEAKRAENLADDSDLKAEIVVATEETRQIKNYIDDLSALLNVSISSQVYSEATIAGFIASASAARSTVSGSLASLTAASQTLISAQTSGDVPGEASSADATIKQAQGAYDAAKANLEKTIIRAPISGTINNISINLGDFVSAFQQVAVVSNNGALEIIAHITPEDRETIAVGNKVKIENEYDAQVNSIAPAVDPNTKKIEIKIGFSAPASELTNGESVHLDIVRNVKKATTKNTTIIAIPIAAVKVGTEQSVVFTVDADHKLVAHEVKMGELVGDKVQILEGITKDLELVTDARGLKDGLQVDLQ